MPYRCDACGRFTAHIHDVWVKYPYPSIDREVCDTCADALGIVSRSKENDRA